MKETVLKLQIPIGGGQINQMAGCSVLSEHCPEVMVHGINLPQLAFNHHLQMAHPYGIGLGKVNEHLISVSMKATRVSGILIVNSFDIWDIL